MCFFFILEKSAYFGDRFSVEYIFFFSVRFTVLARAKVAIWMPRQVLMIFESCFFSEVPGTASLQRQNLLQKRKLEIEHRFP